MGTVVHFSEKFPDATEFGNNVVLFYDKKLYSKNAEARKFIKNFQYKIHLTAGEGLKTLGSYQKYLLQLMKMTQQAGTTDLTFVALGGGSVGDFVGFLASTFKRGVRLIHVPSTWLAAIDSAHGGKTALNVASIKNQIGTFYPAQSIWIVKPLLKSLGAQQINDGWSEVIKLGLMDGRLFTKIEGSLKNNSLWSVLPQAIATKYKVVQQDPFEKNGVRRLLNFGHTLGHVFESHYKMSHGRAVAGGILFAVNMSYQLGHMAIQDYWNIVNSRSHLRLRQHFYQRSNLKSIPAKRLTNVLLQDKKKTQQNLLKYILLKKIGKPTICSMEVGDLVSEYQRQLQNGSF